MEVRMTQLICNRYAERQVERWIDLSEGDVK